MYITNHQVTIRPEEHKDYKQIITKNFFKSHAISSFLFTPI